MLSESAALVVASHALAAAAYALLAGYLLFLGRAWRRGVRPVALLITVVLSAFWGALTSVAAAALNPLFAPAAALFDLLRHAAWYTFVLLLLVPQGKLRALLAQQALWAPVACALLVVGGFALQISTALDLIAADLGWRAWLLQRLAMPLVALLLIEQLLRTVSEDSRWHIKPLCLGLGAQFAFDVYLFADALMFGRIDEDALIVRGVVHALSVPLLAVAALRSRDWTSRIRLSQKAVFHSATLLIAGLYLLFMAGVGYYVRYFGGSWGRALQLALVCAAILVLGMLAVSGSMRAKLRVIIGKHLFTYRYDYREEWLRFTQTLSAQDSPQAMGEHVIRGLANMVESPAGVLWLRDLNNENYSQTARWNMPENTAQESADGSLVRFLLDSGWVVNLEEYRSHRSRYRDFEVPEWLSQMSNAWLVVPLMVGKELAGFVILASSRTAIDVNWEVNDLLRTAGCQAAGFLTKMQATEALLEARKFDAFNKMSAFVVHDLKNIMTQLSLMLKNAERHRGNPEFQEDMLMTVENSVDRMRQLMAQLREGATPSGRACGVFLPEIIEHIRSAKMKQGRVVATTVHDRLSAIGHADRLERVIGHLVQNALDATPPEGSVWIALARRGEHAALEVGDSGKGMTNDFIRERLFKPFQSTKNTGMGIGAYESAQYVRELGGEILVDSEVDRGTRITLMLPLHELHSEAAPAAREAA